VLNVFEWADSQRNPLRSREYSLRRRDRARYHAPDARERVECERELALVLCACGELK